MKYNDENIKNCFCKKKAALVGVEEEKDITPCAEMQSESAQTSQNEVDEIAQAVESQNSTPTSATISSSNVATLSAPHTGYGAVNIAGVGLVAVVLLIGLAVLLKKAGKGVKSKIMAVALMFAVVSSGVVAPHASATAGDLECDGYEVTVKHYYRDYGTGEVADLGVVDTFRGTGVARYDYAVASMTRLVGGDFGDRIDEIPSGGAEAFKNANLTYCGSHQGKVECLRGAANQQGGIEVVSPDWSVNCDGVYEIYYTVVVVHEIEIEDEA